MKATTIINTPLGPTEISGNEEGICSIHILDHAKPQNHNTPEILIPAVDQLTAYFNGDLKAFNLILNPEGTPFQKKVWNALAKIPFGNTMSYLDLSKILGDVKAIRAVAAANGKNPLWIVVPCHRVIGSDGSLTGYAGGVWRKKWLLEHENPPAQQSLF